MSKRNLILVGKAEEIDPLKPEVRAMLQRQGIYLASDTERPGYTVPLVVTADGLFCMTLDTQLDPERFLPTVRITGPFYAPGEEYPPNITWPVLMPPCPFCGGPPVPFVGNAIGGGAAALQDEYGDEGLYVSAHVFCHECGACGPNEDLTIYDREEYLQAERDAVCRWIDRNSRHLALHTAGIPEGIEHYPRIPKEPAGG